MSKKKLIWQLYPSYLIIILISLGTVSWHASDYLENFFLSQTFTELKVRAKILEKQVKPFINPLNRDKIDRICKSIGESVDMRLTVMLIDGAVIGDSEEKPQIMDNHRDRPEVKDANKGIIGKSIRYSRTLNRRMMYVAIPLKADKNVIAILRTSIALTAVDSQIKNIQIRLIMAGLLIALIASGLCYYISRRIVKPIEIMRQFAENFSKGKLNYKLIAPRSQELAGLAEAMNQMASQLVARIETVKKQKNEYEAVLASMVEGVIAIDLDETIISFNQSAAKIFDANINRIEKKSIQEAIRNIELQQFVRQALQSEKIISKEIILLQNEERYFSIHASPLYDANSNQIGALLVLDDITQLRRLEKARKDFVANVSHEIRTPLTAIKGFVETLINGAINNKDEAVRFLSIIEKHANRLSDIVEDLLLLSRIENEEELNRITYLEINIKDIIKGSVSVCKSKAAKKKITVNCKPFEDITLKVNQRLIEQALVNLLDNAIKYSPENSEVIISVENTDKELIICVTDQGNGISRNHLKRLFERFYRVDKARSRKEGGTGLGLAIVKHVAQIHKGKASVESILGKGSSFSIRLPLS